jgi:hypothetical protein
MKIKIIIQNFTNNFIIILFLVIPLHLIAQKPCQRFDKNYVPVHLEGALQYLDCSWSFADKDTFKNKNEDIACSELHRQYGMWMRNS